MAFSGLFKKKKKAPKELPDLAVDDLRDKLRDIRTESESNGLDRNNYLNKLDGDDEDHDPKISKRKIKKIKRKKKDLFKDFDSDEDHDHGRDHRSKDYFDEKLKKEQESVSRIVKEIEEKSEHIGRDVKEMESAKTPEEKEGGFFNDFMKNVHEEIGDLRKLEKWYKNNFLSKDVIKEMKNYWEDKKSDLVINKVGGEFKKKLQEKMEALQDLEKEWQDIYFDLIAKEDEMRKVEAGLKKSISEFMNLTKFSGRKEKNLENTPPKVKKRLKKRGSIKKLRRTKKNG